MKDSDANKGTIKELLAQMNESLAVSQQIDVRDAQSVDELIPLLEQQVQRLIDQNQKLQEQYQGYYDLVQNMHDCLTILDHKGKIIHCNPAFTKLTGWNPAEEEIMIKDVVHPDDMENSKKYLDMLEKEGSYDNYEGRIKCKDGSYRYIQVNSVAIYDDNGNMIGSRDILRDIHETIENRKRLSMQAQLDEMLSNIADLFLKDTYSDLDIYINEALASLGQFFKVDRCYVFSIDFKSNTMTNTHEWCGAGVTAEIDNLKNIPLDTFQWWINKMLKKEIINLHDISELKGVSDDMYELLDVQGIQSLLCVPMVFEGETKGFLGFDDVKQSRVWTQHAISLLKKSAEVFISIIENDRVNKEKERLIKELARVNDELADFAHVVSHDLKAPVRGIVTLSGWLKEDYKDKLDEEGVKQLELLQSRGMRLERLISDILSYSSLKFDEKEQDIDMKMLCNDIVKNLPYEENTYTINCPVELPILHQYNYTRIYQLFQNLITNAVKYNDKEVAQIDVTYKRTTHYHVFVLSDNGIGIEKKYLRKIFELFQKLDNKDASSTGIGLAIVKRVIDLYDGSIHVESTLGEGTAFTIELPFRRQQKSPYLE